jgi:hypothetical protein
MASPQGKYQILPEPLHNKALQYSLKNLDCELAGQSTDDPEFIDGELLSLLLLYCLHIERYELRARNNIFAYSPASSFPITSFPLEVSSC